MTILTKIIPLLLTLFFVSCKGKSEQATQGNNAQQPEAMKTFEIPQIPNTLNTPEEKQDFLAKHFWDNLNFTDTNIIHRPDITEQAWANYCTILTNMLPQIAQRGIRSTIKKAETNKIVFNYFIELADKYLYDPNSPMRNEALYIPVLEIIQASALLSETEKLRPKQRLLMAYKNRPGTKALNFGYTLASGTTGTLNNIHSKYVLLFFNNPGCNSCAETINQIKLSESLNRLIKENQLKVVAIYPDEELNEWYGHRLEFPNDWINGYDEKLSIKSKDLYDLKAIPTLYLLDKNKIVLLKDATVQAIEDFFSTQS